MSNWVLKQECDFCCQGRERTLGARTGEQAVTSKLPGVLFDEGGVLKTCSMELEGPGDEPLLGIVGQIVWSLPPW